MLVLPASVLTCVALHHPGFELDDRVGTVTAVLSLAAHMVDLLTQIQATQDAERAHLPHTEALHLKGQASDGHKGRERVNGRREKQKENESTGTGQTHLLASKEWRAPEQMVWSPLSRRLMVLGLPSKHV